MNVSNIEDEARQRLQRVASPEDIESAYDLWLKLCGLASDFGVNKMDDLGACILALASLHPDYAAFEAQHGGGFAA